ncbi:BLUF domain-containing protein [Hymenobacter rubripertinctus]|uniref:BLUF domain-containing protein n=1 Tax=Hymenobacter rubripertinctus TaxID=2029981 RepID=A0A418QVR3_9BACT|nr:BLUF domain-containing protein [Hymenobacter rubripertinctus]RIY09306.1 BLUF domain-containing protein [Hymenobacter rubripertinctus]
MLQELLLPWRLRNEQCAITGVLLYSEGPILQVLEGEQQAVESLCAHIEHDYRHTAVVKLADGPSAHREFPDWSMGFVVANAEAFARLAGYCNPAHADFPAARSRHLSPAVLALLREFAQTREMPFQELSVIHGSLCFPAPHARLPRQLRRVEPPPLECQNGVPRAVGVLRCVRVRGR